MSRTRGGGISRQPTTAPHGTRGTCDGSCDGVRRGLAAAGIQACGVGPHVRATGLHGGPASSPCPPSAVPGNQRRSEALLPWCARAVAAASRLWTPSPWCRKLLDLGARGRRGAHVHAVKDFIWPPWSTASRQVRVAFRGVWHQYRHVRRSGKVVSYSCIDASAIRTAAWLAGHL